MCSPGLNQPDGSEVWYRVGMALVSMDRMDGLGMDDGYGAMDRMDGIWHIKVE